MTTGRKRPRQTSSRVIQLEAVSIIAMSRVSASTGPGCAARAALNVGDHSQGAQQGSRASGVKPIREAPLRVLCLVTRHLSGTTTRHSSLRAAHSAKTASQPLIWLRALLVFASSLLVFPGASACSADEPLVPANEFVYCTVCHGVQMKGNELLRAPRVSQMEAWYVKRQLEAFKSGWRGSHGEDFAGMEMRPMAAILTPDEIGEVSRYVSAVSSALPSPTIHGDAEKGATHYATCAVCHGSNAEGNEGLGAPALAGRNDWYLVTQLKNFRSGIRGGNAADTFGIQMRAATGTLPDDAAINDVVTYLNTLQAE